MEETYWVHIDTTHADYANIESLIDSKFSERRPLNVLSVNNNNAGTEALIKLVVDADWYASINGDAIKNHAAIIRIYDQSDHDEAYTMVTAPAWTG